MRGYTTTGFQTQEAPDQANNFFRMPFIRDTTNGSSFKVAVDAACETVVRQVVGHAGEQPVVLETTTMNMGRPRDSSSAGGVEVNALSGNKTFQQETEGRTSGGGQELREARAGPAAASASSSSSPATSTYVLRKTLTHFQETMKILEKYCVPDPATASVTTSSSSSLFSGILMAGAAGPGSHRSGSSRQQGQISTTCLKLDGASNAPVAFLQEYCQYLDHECQRVVLTSSRGAASGGAGGGQNPNYPFATTSGNMEEPGVDNSGSRIISSSLHDAMTEELLDRFLYAKNIFQLLLALETGNFAQWLSQKVLKEFEEYDKNFRMTKTSNHATATMSSNLRVLTHEEEQTQVLTKVFYCLLANDLQQACTVLLVAEEQQGLEFERLLQIITALAPGEEGAGRVDRKYMADQVNHWTQLSAETEMPEKLWDIYCLLAGKLKQIHMFKTSENLTCWTLLAACYWYGENYDDNVSTNSTSTSPPPGGARQNLRLESSLKITLEQLHAVGVQMVGGNKNYDGINKKINNPHGCNKRGSSGVKGTTAGGPYSTTSMQGTSSCMILKTAAQECAEHVELSLLKLATGSKHFPADASDLKWIFPASSSCTSRSSSSSFIETDWLLAVLLRAFNKCGQYRESDSQFAQLCERLVLHIERLGASQSGGRRGAADRSEFSVGEGREVGASSPYSNYRPTSSPGAGDHELDGLRVYNQQRNRSSKTASIFVALFIPVVPSRERILGKLLQTFDFPKNVADRLRVLSSWQVLPEKHLLVMQLARQRQHQDVIGVAKTLEELIRLLEYQLHTIENDFTSGQLHGAQQQQVVASNNMYFFAGSAAGTSNIFSAGPASSSIPPQQQQQRLTVQLQQELEHCVRQLKNVVLKKLFPIVLKSCVKRGMSIPLKEEPLTPEVKRNLIKIVHLKHSQKQLEQNLKTRLEKNTIGTTQLQILVETAYDRAIIECKDRLEVLSAAERDKMSVVEQASLAFSSREKSYVENHREKKGTAASKTDGTQSKNEDGNKMRNTSRASTAKQTELERTLRLLKNLEDARKRNCELNPLEQPQSVFEENYKRELKVKPANRLKGRCLRHKSLLYDALKQCCDANTVHTVFDDISIKQQKLCLQEVKQTTSNAINPSNLSNSSLLNASVDALCAGVRIALAYEKYDSLAEFLYQKLVFLGQKLPRLQNDLCYELILQYRTHVRQARFLLPAGEEGNAGGAAAAPIGATTTTGLSCTNGSAMEVDADTGKATTPQDRDFLVPLRLMCDALDAFPIY
ncbi:unnamed protein product [Amoebophrya sp. A120]|nr:unnamed protein product [Amoebophrya sp. A120]|eukprot:GSA120T00007053001.1